MRILTFSKRCAKDILRDPLNLAFGLGFPVVLLILLSAMQKNIPNDMFAIWHLAPGISVFGLSFITLFSATLVARDRESSFLQRLYTTPLRPFDFIIGYMLPLVPISLIQGAISYALALVLGLDFSIYTVLAVLMIAPISMLYISLGLLFGSMLNVKQVGGICGGLLTNLSAWLSGIWFDISLVGGVFEKVGKALPFYHAVELERAILSGVLTRSLPHFGVVAVYAALVTVCASLLFLRQMKKQ